MWVHDRLLHLERLLLLERTASGRYRLDRPSGLATPVTADTVRLIIRDNVCTGGRDSSHERESDPTNPSDCRSTATNITPGDRHGAGGVPAVADHALAARG